MKFFAPSGSQTDLLVEDDAVRRRPKRFANESLRGTLFLAYFKISPERLTAAGLNADLEFVAE